MAHHINAITPQDNTALRFVAGALANMTPTKYTADQPADSPVRTVYPQVSDIGGHLEDMMDNKPAKMNTIPQKLIGAHSRA